MTTEIKDLVTGIATAFEEYKQTNDARIEAIKAGKGTADLDAKLARMDGAIDGMSEVKAKLAKIDYRLDVNTLEQEAASGLAMNDIARITLKLAQPVVADRYADNRATGAFIIIDESTNNTVGAGMIG